MWRFPEIGFSLIKHPFLGTPIPMTMETSKKKHELHQSYDRPPPATAPQTNDGTMRHKSVATFRVCKANSLVGDRTVAKVPFLRAFSRLSWGSYLQIGAIQHEETGTST